MKIVTVGVIYHPGRAVAHGDQRVETMFLERRVECALTDRFAGRASLDIGRIVKISLRLGFDQDVLAEKRHGCCAVFLVEGDDLRQRPDRRSRALQVRGEVRFEFEVENLVLGRADTAHVRPDVINYFGALCAEYGNARG